jgi:hypothetical protein
MEFIRGFQIFTAFSFAAAILRGCPNTPNCGWTSTTELGPAVQNAAGEITDVQPWRTLAVSPPTFWDKTGHRREADALVEYYNYQPADGGVFDYGVWEDAVLTDSHTETKRIIVPYEDDGTQSLPKNVRICVDNKIHLEIPQ